MQKTNEEIPVTGTRTGQSYSQLHPVRVLHVGPGWGQKGGIASVMEELASQSECFRRGGIWLFCFETHSFKNRTDILRFFFLDIPRFWGALTETIDIVHFHVSVRGSFFRKFLLYLIARFARKKTVVHLHAGGFSDFYQNAGPATRWAVSRLIGRSSAAIAVSTDVLNELKRHRDHIARTYVIGNTSSAAEFARIDNAPPIVSRREIPYIAFAGRITEEKGVDDLIKAVTLLKKEKFSIELWIAGSGDTAYWTRKAFEHGIGNQVRFMGWLTGEDKLDFYRRARLFCMPSYFESFGISTLEAMFCSLPVVGTRLGGFLDLVVDGQTGYLVKPGDPQSLAKYIKLLIEDPRHAEMMGNAGSIRAHKHYSTEAIIDRYVNCYRDILG